MSKLIFFLCIFFHASPRMCTPLHLPPSANDSKIALVLPHRKFGTQSFNFVKIDENMLTDIVNSDQVYKFQIKLGIHLP